MHPTVVVVQGVAMAATSTVPATLNALLFSVHELYAAPAMSRSAALGKPTAWSDVLGIRNCCTCTSEPALVVMVGFTTLPSAMASDDIVSRHPSDGFDKGCASMSAKTRSPENLDPLASTTVAWKPE